MVRIAVQIEMQGTPVQVSKQWCGATKDRAASGAPGSLSTDKLKFNAMRLTWICRAVCVINLLDIIHGALYCVLAQIQYNSSKIVVSCRLVDVSTRCLYLPGAGKSGVLNECFSRSHTARLHVAVIVTRRTIQMRRHHLSSGNIDRDLYRTLMPPQLPLAVSPPFLHQRQVEARYRHRAAHHPKQAQSPRHFRHQRQ
jgi:hypothetical protein